MAGPRTWKPKPNFLIVAHPAPGNWPGCKPLVSGLLGHGYVVFPGRVGGECCEDISKLRRSVGFDDQLDSYAFDVAKLTLRYKNKAGSLQENLSKSDGQTLNTASGKMGPGVILQKWSVVMV